MDLMERERKRSRKRKREKGKREEEKDEASVKRKDRGSKNEKEVLTKESENEQPQRARKRASKRRRVGEKEKKEDAVDVDKSLMKDIEIMEKKANDKGKIGSTHSDFDLKEVQNLQSQVGGLSQENDHSFAAYSLNDATISALRSIHVTQLFPMQEEVRPLSLTLSHSTQTLTV